MVEHTNAVAFRALTINDIEKLRNSQLKQAMATLINAGDDEPFNRVLLEELRNVKEAMAEMATLKKGSADFI
ncbi:hypothetical protein E2C01_050546 [Portunus trituberculatus]|uniref:Uncharacterized protein n=1 Tax=Portunus trituberculatus TaxID=210409 RepID=A0A5B7GCE5_PORTR|nr:hypothetical protein [Portunus trituberculatus]